MMDVETQTALQIGSCAACALGGWSFAGVFAGSEFGGGSVTGPLLRTYEASLVLFAIAAVLTFGLPRALLPPSPPWPVYSRCLSTRTSRLPAHFAH